jgi:hypothetical protein
MQDAYEVYVELTEALGRAPSYSEILRLVAYNEYGRAQLPPDQYEVSTEAMGRQFYNFCGADGICEGLELWKFLGAQEAWYDASGSALAGQLRSGIVPVLPAALVFGHPPFDASSATEESIRENWRSGNVVRGIYSGQVPFVYGNYSMYSNTAAQAFALIPSGISGQRFEEGTVFLHNGLFKYVVLTVTQDFYWKSK